MKIADIITQLKTVLPVYTNYFSDNASVSSLTYAAGTATATSTAHGLSIGHIVNIKGAYSPNTITSLTQVAGVATAITAQPHDLTEDWSTLVIAGATQTEYNGTKTLLTVDSSTQFTFTVDSGAVSPATGSPQLNEIRANQYNGIKTVTAVPTVDTFQYAIDTDYAPYNTASGTIYADKYGAIRISGALNIETAVDSYTEKSTNDLWAFVVPNATNASKNRQLENDANYQFGAGTDYRQQLINQFSVYVFANASNEIAALEKSDIMEDIRKYLFSSLLGFKFDTGFSEGSLYGVVFVSDDIYSYNGAVYIHQLIFEIIYDINADDIVVPPDSVAFRNIQLTYENIDNSDTIKEDTGTLEF